MRLRLTADQVLIRLDATEEASEGKHGASILLAHRAQAQPTTGTVLAVGPGIRTKRGLRPTSLRKGDRVLVGFRPGQDLSVDGVPHYLAHEFHEPIEGEGILGVIEG